MRTVEKDNEIKNELENRGFDGLFEKTQDYLNTAIKMGDKKPISITIIVETEESTFVSQKLDARKAHKHRSENLYEAIRRTEDEHDNGGDKKDSKTDDALAHINGMCHLALELGELAENEADEDGKIKASEIQTMASAIILTEVQKTLPKDKFKSMVNQALDHLFDGEE